MVTEVLGGGKFYVQTVGDQKLASIQQQLASLNLKDVLAHFSADNSWNRAMVRGHSNINPLFPLQNFCPASIVICGMAIHVGFSKCFIGDL